MALPLIGIAAALYTFITRGSIFLFLKVFTIALIAKLIFVFGLTFVVYNGLDTLMLDWKNKVLAFSSFSAFSEFPQLLEIINILRLDDALNIIISTYVSMISLRLSQGAYRFFTLGLG